MTGDHFVFIIFNGTDRDGREQSLSENAVYQLLHFRIIFYPEGMPFKGSQLINRQLCSLCFIINQSHDTPFSKQRL